MSESLNNVLDVIGTQPQPARPPPAVIADTVSGGAQPADGWFCRAVRSVLTTVGTRLWALQVQGRGQLPDAGPAILAANHLSFFDSVALIMAVPRPLSFVGKAEYLDSWKTRHLLPALGMIPIDRTHGFPARRALDTATGILRNDGLFAIYPEGTRSPDGKLHAGHRGVGHLGVVTGAPIIPTGILGTAAVQPPGARLPRPFRQVQVCFGHPIDTASYRGSPRQRRRQITHDVMMAIRDLTGQAYITEPATVPAG